MPWLTRSQADTHALTHSLAHSLAEWRSVHEFKVHIKLKRKHKLYNKYILDGVHVLRVWYTRNVCASNLYAVRIN